MCVLEQGKERKRVSEEEKRSQRQRLTDEELFYDPHMDEEDEQWVKRQRMAYHNGQYPCTTTVSTPVPQRSVPLTTIVSMYLQPLVFSPPISLQPVVFPLISLLHVVLWC